MDIKTMLNQVNGELERLTELKSLLVSFNGNPRSAVSPKRTLSAEARRRISRAQKARWRKQRAVAKKAA